MKLYTSVGPNPLVVLTFMREKGIEIPLQKIDLRGGENRQEEYLNNVNPMGQLPALELDDGSVLTEIVAICEYLDEISDGPSLVGETPEERAKTRMWIRRIDLNILEPLGDGYRSAEGLPMFKARIYCMPDAADDFKKKAQLNLTKIDGIMGDREYVVGDRFSLADIIFYCWLNFGIAVGQPLNPDNKNIAAWFERMQNRFTTDKK
jgi:glutathione S-transferase